MSGFKLIVLLVTVVFLSCGAGSKFSHVGQLCDAIHKAVNSKSISEERLKERKAALQATQQSLVLLKNNLSILPVTDITHIKNIVFVGDTNDLRMQNGEWTKHNDGQQNNHDVLFQGDDNVTSGSNTIQECVQTLLGRQFNYYTVNEMQNSLPHAGLTGSNTLVIAVVAEQSHSKSTTLELPYSAVEQKIISTLRNQGIRTITIIYSARPMIIGDPNRRESQSFPLNNSDVVIAAFFPGSLGGQAITDAIFGHYLFGSVSTDSGRSNRLTFPWPANREQVANHFAEGSLYPVGYGLSSKLVIQSE